MSASTKLPEQIVDTHSHTPGQLFGPTSQTVRDVREEFSAAGITRAWIFTLDGLILNARASNDDVARVLGEDLDFFVPFCTVNPYEGTEVCVRELRRCHRELGMRGLKFHPWLQAFPWTRPELIPILETAGEFGWPVLFHDGTPPYSTPFQIAALAEKVPGTNVILGHAGLGDLTEDSILACLRHENIYLSLTSLTSGPMIEAIRRAPPDRLLFGSDGGFLAGMAQEAIEKLRVTQTPPDLLRRICWDNPMRLIPA